jgi:hypothetical protein
VGVPSTGGQIVRQLPVQIRCVGVSTVFEYRVWPFGPTSTPPDVSEMAIVAPPAAADDDDEDDGGDDDVGGAEDAPPPPPLDPQAARRRAAGATRTARRIMVKPPIEFTCWYGVGAPTVQWAQS